MLYKARNGQVNYGESIGILLLDTFTPFIPGDVGNASTYSFPVRYKTVNKLTVERMLSKDLSFLDSFIEAGRELVQDGVKAVTGDCGFMALYQKEVANALEVPVFLSSLLQVPFISRLLRDGEKVGIITASSKSIDQALLEAVGITGDIPITIKGMESKEHFYQAIIEEIGILDSEKIEKEVVTAALEMIEDDPMVKAMLLECSVLPPYGAAVQRAVNLPVFDYITMINYVHSAVVKNRFNGFMQEMKKCTVSKKIPLVRSRFRLKPIMVFKH